MNITTLDVGIGVAVITGGLLYYIKRMKQRVKKYVLRNEEINKYFGKRK